MITTNRVAGSEAKSEEPGAKSCGSWQGDDQAGAAFVLQVELAADGFDAGSHAAEAVAFAGWGGRGAVVGDEEAAGAGVGGEAEGAGGGTGVAHDVGDGLAEGEGEDGLFVGSERWGTRTDTRAHIWR